MKKREESGGEALAVHFDDGAKDGTCAERKFKGRYIYVIGCAIPILKPISKSLRLLYYERASESNRKLCDSESLFSSFKFSYDYLFIF